MKEESFFQTIYILSDRCGKLCFVKAVTRAEHRQGLRVTHQVFDNVQESGDAVQVVTSDGNECYRHSVCDTDCPLRVKVLLQLSV